MAQQASHLTQSAYYTPAFNSAIFDGGIRIYFSQSQEAAALKIYFCLQEEEKDLGDFIKKKLNLVSANIYILIYPTQEIFALSFETGGQSFPSIVERKLGNDYIIGVSGPLRDEDAEEIYEKLRGIKKLFSSSDMTSSPRDFQETV